MNSVELTRQYFQLSNERKLETIRYLFEKQATYSSDNTGLYFGRDAIMRMMGDFFDAFPSLYWEIHSLVENTPHIAEVDFTLVAKKTDGSKILRPGIERVVVVNGLIRHVEVRNKSS